MKILLVHGDINPWATHNRALEMKRQWVDDEVDIMNCSQELKDDYDAIHILFSGGMRAIKEFIVRNKAFTTVASQRTLDLVYDNIKILTEIYQSSKKIVVQNPMLKTRLMEMIDLDEDKIVYIPNGIDEKMFKREFVVGFVGSEQSGNQEYKGFKLVEQACNDLGLALRRVYNGYPQNVIPLDEMPKFYEKIDCLVIPSKGEGCNNPTLEALAMNKPVISTDVGIAKRLDGVILVKRDVKSIKKALRKLSGRIQILEKYTWDIVCKQYRDLY